LFLLLDILFSEPIDFIEFRRDSAIQASLTALTAPSLHLNNSSEEQKVTSVLNFFMPVLLTLKKSFNCFAALHFIFLCQFWMHGCAATLDGAYDFEAGITGYLTHSTDGTSRLLEQDVPRSGRWYRSSPQCHHVSPLPLA
jgi:hypothetical protein